MGLKAGMKSVKRADNQTPIYESNYTQVLQKNAKSHEMHITSFGSSSHMEQYQSAEKEGPQKQLPATVIYGQRKARSVMRSNLRWLSKANETKVAKQPNLIITARKYSNVLKHDDNRKFISSQPYENKPAQSQQASRNIKSIPPLRSLEDQSNY